MKLLLLLCLATSVLGCGLHLRNPDNDAYTRAKRMIIGGAKVSTASKWPWQVLLTFESEDESGICGGTIIGEEWVLTAAHCLENTSISDITVNAGATLLTDVKKEYIRGVIDGKMHSEYESKFLIHDIAILKLDKPLVFDEVASSICLPNPSQSIVNDGQAVITGFGRIDGVIDGEISPVSQSNPQLREAMVPIVPPEICEERWSQADPELEQEIRNVWSKNHVVCASSLAHGTHKGDSGGPLMMRARNERWFQIGISSFIYCEESSECDEPGDGIDGDAVPKVFTDVRKYCKWIEEATGGEVNCYGQEVVLEDAGIAA